MSIIQLGYIIKEITDKTTINNQYEVLTSSQDGIVSQEEYFNKQVASKDNVGYKIIRKGQFTYRSMSDTGRFYINRLDNKDIGIVSPAYPVFEISSDKIIPEYLQLFFKSRCFQNQIFGKSTGSTRLALKYNRLQSININLPDVSIQKDFVKNFNILKQSVEKCRLLEGLFDELVNARFVEMFGDLNKNPMGWELKSFEDITDIITDGEHATPRRVDKGIYLLSARNVLNHSLQLDDVDYIDEDEYERISKRIVPQAGDVLLSCSGTVGRCCCVPEGLKFQMVRSTAILRFKEVLNPVFAEYMITSDYVQKQIDKAKTASSQANLFQGKIAKLQGFVPPIELQNQFLVFVNQLNKSKATLKSILEHYNELTDKLMDEHFLL